MDARERMVLRMGRRKKEVYSASAEFIELTAFLIQSYPDNKALCKKYEATHGMLIRKLQLQDVYSVENGGYDEPFLQYRSSEGIQREALEDYLDAKKKVYLLEYNIHGMEDEQMKAVARKLFLEQEQQKCAEITVNGHIISQRTVCREKQRAITYLAWCIEGYASWEAEMLFS